MRVMEGGCTDSREARAPRVGDSSWPMLAKAEAWDWVSPPADC